MKRHWLGWEKWEVIEKCNNIIQQREFKKIKERRSVCGMHPIQLQLLHFELKVTPVFAGSSPAAHLQPQPPLESGWSSWGTHCSQVFWYQKWRLSAGGKEGVPYTPTISSFWEEVVDSVFEVISTITLCDEALCYIFKLEIVFKN